MVTLGRSLRLLLGVHLGVARDSCWFIKLGGGGVVTRQVVVVIEGRRTAQLLLSKPFKVDLLSLLLRLSSLDGLQLTCR